MRALSLVAICAAGLLVAPGCTGRNAPWIRAALDCPTTAGQLKRTGATADGKTCTYADAAGDELSLRLIPVATTPAAALAPVEQELQAVATAPPPSAGPAAANTSASAAIGQAEADATAADDDLSDGPDHGSDHGHADISLPGLHIHADGDKADVDVGGVHVNASSEGAVVRSAQEVRLRGQAFALERRGYRATYVLARKDLPGGWSAIGYEAGGPRAGPLTVAVVKTRGDDHNAVLRHARRLVRLNGGV